MNELILAEQLKKNLTVLGNYLVDELQKELTQQGHKATGSLIQSIQYEVEFFINELSLAVSYLDYGLIIENGVSPQRIPFGGSKKGDFSKYISALMAWIKQKGLEQDEKSIKGFAFAIAKKHKKEGMPTKNSYKFAKNGRRLGFQNFVITQNRDKINKLIGKNLAQTVSSSLDTVISNIQKSS